MPTCRYLVAKGDGFSPWYWCQHLGKQVRPAEHGCGTNGCPQLRAAAARAKQPKPVKPTKQPKRRKS